MKLIPHTPSEGLNPNNPFANSCQRRYAYATQMKTEYLVTLGERLKTRTWFVVGNHCDFFLKKAAQAERIMNFYRDRRNY